MAQHIVAIFRPEPDASRTAGIVRERGHIPVVAPSSEIRFPNLPATAFTPMEPMIVTSRNAVRALERAIPKTERDLYRGACAGRKTHSLAFDYGFSHFKQVEGTAEDLLRAVLDESTRDERNATHVYVRGRDISLDIAQSLTEKGVRCREHIVYESVPRSWIAQEVAALKYAEDAVWLHFSPRQAEVTVEIARQSDLPLPPASRHFCMSDRVAGHLCSAAEKADYPTLNEADIKVAAAPQLQELLALLGPSTAG